MNLLFDSAYQRQVALLVCVAVVAFFVVLPIIENPEVGHLDFQVYYYSAVSIANGQNPYSLEQHQHSPDRAAPHEFTYLPFILWVVYPLQTLTFSSATNLYLLLKIAALLGLFWIWSVLDKRTHRFLFLIVAFVSFNNPIAIDLLSGNISLFLQLLVWIGLWCFLQDRIGLFALCITLSATVKLTPLLLLGLLFVRDRSDITKWLPISLVGFILFIAGNYILYPEYFNAFLQNSLKSAMEFGSDNPASFPFLIDLYIKFGELTSVSLPPYGEILSYLVFVSIILLHSVPLIFWIDWNELNGEERVLLMCAVCLLYGIVSPRFKNFQYVLLLFPVYHVIVELSHRTDVQYGLFALLLLVTNDSIGILEVVTGSAFLQSYSSFLTILVLWFYVRIRLLPDLFMTKNHNS